LVLKTVRTRVRDIRARGPGGGTPNHFHERIFRREIVEAGHELGMIERVPVD
jgi:hypothetical protein